MTHTAQPIPLRLLLLNIHRRHIVISSSKKVMNNLPFITQAIFFLQLTLYKRIRKHRKC